MSVGIKDNEVIGMRKQEKIKLFRKGRLVGLVTPQFEDSSPKPTIWDKLDLAQIQ